MSPKKRRDKPTTYRGKCCRSRLEARWAVFLDYHFMVNQWDHEPYNYELTTGPNEGWEYTPDFLFKVGPWMGFLEVTATQPSDEYLEYLREFIPLLPKDIWLAVGDFTKGVPVITNLSQPDGETFSLDAVPFLASPEDAIKTAKAFRFNAPHPVPGFRKGKASNVRGFTPRLTGEQSRATDAQTKRKKKNKS